VSLYNTTLSQTAIFAAFLYVGVILGIVHTTIRGIRNLFGKSRILAALADVFFLMAAGGLFFFAMYRLTELRMRGYHFLGAAAGYVLYSAAVRPLVIWINCKFRKKKIDNSRSK